MNISTSHNLLSLIPLVVTLHEVITATEKEITPRDGKTESGQRKLPSAYIQSPNAPHPTMLSIISEEQNVMNSAIGDADANLDVVRSTWSRLSLGAQEIKSPFNNTDSGGSPTTLSAGFDQNNQTSNATTVVRGRSKVSIKESEDSSTSVHFTPSRTELHGTSFHGTSKPLFGDISKPLFGDISKPLFGGASKPLFGDTSKPLFNFAADANKGELFKLNPINDALPTTHGYAEKQSETKQSPTSARPESKALGSPSGSLGKDHTIVTKTSTLVGRNGFDTSHIEQRPDATKKVPVSSHTVHMALRQMHALPLDDRIREAATKEVGNKEQENLQRGKDGPRPRIKIPFRGYSIWSDKYTGQPRHITGIIVRLPPAKEEHEKSARKSLIFKDSISFSQFTQQLGQNEKDGSPETAHVEVVEINDDKWEDIDSDEENIDSDEEDIDSDEVDVGSGEDHIDSSEKF
ncbi:hypothetical protein B0O99DRAFT_678300 [Bisporella sp. PMI_857]|nr:hypothetical protein B0O99DRAFT_678300 [Bisporella sp. PMI_857]